MTRMGMPLVTMGQLLTLPAQDLLWTPMLS
jgi:hypothetical protein